MPQTIRTIPRAHLPENGVLTFAVGTLTCVIADVEGTIEAFSVAGRAAGYVDRAAIVDGHVLCPLHGWPIDTAAGGCAAGTLCRYETLPVEVADGEIRVRVREPA